MPWLTADKMTEEMMKVVVESDMYVEQVKGWPEHYKTRATGVTNADIKELTDHFLTIARPKETGKIYGPLVISRACISMILNLLETSRRCRDDEATENIANGIEQLKLELSKIGAYVNSN